MASVLYDDLLLAVLERCDIQSVLAMGKASVHFNALSRSKQVWRALVWDLAPTNLINSYPGARKVEDFTVDELIDEVKRVTLGTRLLPFEMPSEDVFMLLLYPPSGPSNDIQLIRIDLSSGDSAVVFKVRVTPSKDVEPCILGQFICAGVKLCSSGHTHFLLFNWVDSHYMLFRLQSEQHVLATLLPGGHLLFSVAEPIPPGRQLLLLFSLGTLRNHWRPIHNRIQYTEFVDVFDRIYLFERHPALMTFVDETETWPARRWQLRVLADVLCRGSYRILLYASDVVHAERARKTSPKQATLYSFRISLKRSSFVGWERISAVPAVPGVQNFSKISTYSGYCFARMGDSIRLVSLRLDAGEAAKQRIVDGLVAGLANLDGVSVTTMGGLVTFEKSSSGPPQMAVSYYW
ncbi:hypothetical protein MVEN_01480100 [Mycena venus]|uniref:F-box domain-containing protein n=1 Tax=Mycena venus TaxID=2733690 RepID=A0A8H6XVC3_9AGAR|nr:hypothetical protein MVEN_01480100 [Mycena venus]